MCFGVIHGTICAQSFTSQRDYVAAFIHWSNPSHHKEGMLLLLHTGQRYAEEEEAEVILRQLYKRDAIETQQLSPSLRRSIWNDLE